MRRPLEGFERWDVVSVPFPYTNRPIEQRRPALVVGRCGGDGAPVFLWVLMITSAAHRRWVGDVEIGDLGAAGLPAASIVRTVKIATVENVTARRLGTLDEETRLAVDDSIRASLR